MSRRIPINRTFPKGSKSELFTLVMRKHMDFQAKYTSKGKEYPEFIPLTQFKFEASNTMDDLSTQDQYEVAMLSNLDSYKQLLKEITATVTSNYSPNFNMNKEYLDALDQMIEFNLISFNIPFSFNLNADFCVSHVDINQLAQTVATLVVLKNPFVDMNDKKLIESLVRSNLRMLNCLIEHPLNEYLFEKLVFFVKHLKQLSNINNTMLAQVRSIHKYGHVALLSTIGMNLSNKQLVDLLKAEIGKFVTTENSEFNIVSSICESLENHNIKLNEMKISEFNEIIHKTYFQVSMNSKTNSHLEMMAYIQDAGSSGVLGMFANIFSHQFLMGKMEEDHAFINFMPLHTPLSATEHWIAFLTQYLQCVDSAYDFDDAKPEDLRLILKRICSIIELFQEDQSQFSDSVIEEVVKAHLKNKMSNSFYFDVAKYS